MRPFLRAAWGPDTCDPHGLEEWRRGGPVEPLTSVHDAVATWPETATAVAVRLDAGDAIEICAPFGLADLLDGVWRRNPRRISMPGSLARLVRHRPRIRWPGVTVIPPE